MIDGTAQSQRFPPALAPGWFGVDELRLEQLIAMCARYAAALQFVDSDGRAQGDWGEMLAHDEAVVLAGLCGFDIERAQALFVDDFDAAPLPQLARQLLALVSRIDRWYRVLAELDQPAARLLAPRIAQAVAPLAGEVAAVRALLRELPEGDALQRLAQDLQPIWQPAPDAAPARTPRAPRELLRATFFALLHAVETLQQLAFELLPRSLESQAHAPAPALLIAMLQVYGRVQQHVNGLVERRIDFYYGECLRLAPRPAEADHLHLVLGGEPGRAREISVPAGARFVAGKDSAGRAIEYAADAGVRVGDARVAALLTLRLERDRLISPECAFGFVTRGKASRLPLPAAAAAAPGDGPRPRPSWPLFGGTVRGAGASVAEDARIGLAVASPLLWLQEGQREIRLTLEFAFGEGEVQSLLERACAAPTRAEFATALGRLLVRWLFDAEDRLDDAALAAIRDAAQRVGAVAASQAAADHGDDAGGRRDPGAGDPLSLLWGAHRPNRELMLDQLCNGVFEVSLSSAQGWHAVADLAVLRPQPALEAGASGLTLVLKLPIAAPAIVACRRELHGDGWPEGQPLLRLQLGRQARLYPLSLFDGVGLAALALDVRVNGLRELSAYNQLGRLDPSKPFTPFGPLPSTASYLVIGAAELARKNLDELALHFTWGALPAGSGGFERHYAGYGSGFGNRDFAVATAVLRDGVWDDAAGAGEPLFAEQSQGRLLPTSALTLPPAVLRARWRPGDPAVGLDQGARDAFVKLQLVRPAQAFGHQLYPRLLTDAVSTNARRRRARTVALPQPPYTPLVERLTITYRASQRIRIDESMGDGAAAGRVWHLRPFGLQEIHPGLANGRPTVLPNFGGDGQLLIGIAGSGVGGPISLLFELREEAAVERQVRAGLRPPVAWSVLVDDRWQPLAPAQVLSDTTAGLLCSGIVTLGLPMALRRDHLTLPDGLVWLRLATPAGSERFAGLHAVHAQAVRATRSADGSEPGVPMPAGSVTAPAAAIDGLRSVLQPGASFGQRAAEDAARFRTRAGERLRHKNRACLPWDFERLVLERFPSVYKVKCLDSRAGAGHGNRDPGRLVVVVVPVTARNEAGNATHAARLNAAELERIEDALRPLASPLARIVVRNAAYERVQLRCGVQLARGTSPGEAVQRITGAVIGYLSPWHDVGYGPRFDWTVRGEDLEACIRALPGVRSVGRVSLIHFGEDDQGRFWLADSARQPAAVATLAWRDPWSLVLPTSRHIIEVDAGAAADDAPRRTGIAELAIGSTFIVGGRSASQRA